jgi:hypothetical protein
MDGSTVIISAKLNGEKFEAQVEWYSGEDEDEEEDVGVALEQWGEDIEKMGGQKK